jgi:hypothetical protein
MIIEAWKNIPELNGMYEVSNHGRLRSYWNRGGKSVSAFPRILSLSVNGNGYPTKYINGANYRLHRLVAQMFIPNPDNLPVINHIDGDKTNNHVSNLEWCNKSHNERHAQRMGLKNKALGEKCNKSHLSNEVVLEIFKSGLGCRELGRMYGVYHSTVLSIKTGKTWNHVTGMPIVPNKRNVSNLP